LGTPGGPLLLGGGVADLETRTLLNPARYHRPTKFHRSSAVLGVLKILKRWVEFRPLETCFSQIMFHHASFSHSACIGQTSECIITENNQIIEPSRPAYEVIQLRLLEPTRIDRLPC